MNARRPFLMFCLSCCVLGFVLVFGAVSAFAAAPVEEEFLTGVSSSSATLNATVNPGGVAGEYRFEYSSGGGTFQAVPGGEGALGEGTAGVHVKAELEGLAPDTTYSYRVSAVFSGGSVPGESLTFTTQQAAGAPSTLVDGRQWEMVSPPNKHGSGIEAMNFAGGALQAAEDGSGLAYWASGPVVSEPEGNTAFENHQVLSRRDAPGVWSSQDIATPRKGTGTIPLGEGSEYKMFSADLSRAVLEPRGETLLPPPNKSGPEERTIYMRDDQGNVYQALVNEDNIVAGAHLGEIFGRRPIAFVGASPDLKHILFDSLEPLTVREAGVEPAAVPGFSNIYEWSGEPGQEGTVSLVSFLPPGETSSASTNLPGNEAREVGRDVVSTDGSRVVWTGGPSTGSANLYVTDMERHESLLVQASGQMGDPKFQDANAEGTKIFFTDQERLTAGADQKTAGEQGDLYVFEVPRTGGSLSGTLRDLTADQHEVGGEREVGNMLGYLIGSGAEGSAATETTAVYFVDGGVLAENKGAGGREAASGGQNLYVERQVGGVWQTPRFIADLALSDAHTWGAVSNNGVPDPGAIEEFNKMTSGVSRSGRYLAFMSSESLTGFDNRDVASGVRDEEVFVYDAVTDKLACASCNAFGVRPHGVFDQGGFNPLLVDRPYAWAGHWLAGSLPGWYNNINVNLAQYEPRFLSDSGRLVFDSPDALVPGDSNGREDVYEYEPEGIGSCSPGVHSQDVVFREEAGVKGCVGLVSSGTSSEESAFLDASGKGPGGEEAEDVFFATKSQLASRDIDSAYDAYDAHQCSSTAPCASGAGSVPPACIDADSCRAAPSVQPTLFGAPSSATFSGAGNTVPQTVVVPAKAKGLTRAQRLARALAACRHRPRRTRQECVVRARKEFGPLHTSKSKSGRGK
jgi:hypothetical protein